MRLIALFFVILTFVSCSKDHNSIPGIGNGMDTLPAFTVTVVERAATKAIITWTAAPLIFDTDTVKYDIVLNGKTIRTNRLVNIDTLTNLSPDSLYKGRVYARTLSGDTASAAFVLEKINGYIVFGDNDGSVNCFDIYSGLRLWKTAYTASEYYFRGMPTIVDSSIYINSDVRGIFAINAKNGTTIWQNLDAGGGIANPIYKDGIVYTTGFGKSTVSKIYALNSANGQVMWSFSEGSDKYQSNPVISNNLLFEYAYSSPDKIVAIDITTGKKSWESNTYCAVSVSPAVHNGLLIFGGSDGKIYALNQATGTTAWIRDFSVYYNNFGADLVSPRIFNNLVIVHSGNSGYYGLNVSTGATVWNYSSGPDVSSPTIGNNLLYFTNRIGGNTNAIALNPATGTLVWKYSFGNSFYLSTPIFAKNRLYFGNNRVYGWGIPVLDAINATPVGGLAYNVYQTGPEVVVADDSVFYASQSGMVQ
jgi:outer membrane protein assembly factor BamB